jgi:hypothetical protein
MADDTTTLEDDTATGADQKTPTPAGEQSDDLGDAGRKAAMSDQERAVAEARAVGVTEAARNAAPRLVRAELRAAAAEAGLGRDALAGFLDYADLNRFVTEDGEVDDKAITAAIKKLGGGRPADFDGGARTPAAKPSDMNSLIRRAAGLG